MSESWLDESVERRLRLASFRTALGFWWLGAGECEPKLLGLIFIPKPHNAGGGSAVTRNHLELSRFHFLAVEPGTNGIHEIAKR